MTIYGNLAFVSVSAFIMIYCGLLVIVLNWLEIMPVWWMISKLTKGRVAANVTRLKVTGLWGRIISGKVSIEGGHVITGVKGIR